MDNQSETDINNVFDSIALSEEKISNEAFQEGLNKGIKDGKLEGYHLGFHKGLELGVEIGFYNGITKVLVKYLNSNVDKKSEKVNSSLERLIELLNNFPKENNKNIDLSEKISELHLLCHFSINMTVTSEEITEQLNKLLCFIEPVNSLITGHLNSFFTNNCWDQCLPKNIHLELSNPNSVKTFIEIYPEIIKNKCPNDFIENHPNVVDFVKKAVSLSIIRDEKYVKLLCYLNDLVKSKGYCKNWNEKLEKLMPQKKLHEVKETSAMTAFLCDLSQSNYIVDIGGGKGYLSCSLALDYSFKVLGLDFLEINTCGAAKRSENVARFWDGQISKKSHTKKALSTKKEREEYIQNQFKQVTTFVKPNTNIEDFLCNNFNEEITGITLTGLHTCGDLSSTCLRMFLTNEKVKGLINIGCCYNKITEEFDSQNLAKTDNYGFPLSSFLKNKNYTLGRNAKMLACHSIDRITSTFYNPEFEHSQNALFYRAIIEVFREKMDESTNQQNLKRLAKKCNSYHEFMYKGLKEFGISDSFTEEDLDRAYEYYIDKKPLLTAFYLLRVSLAPVVESIILLDRILYLIENGINNVYLVPLFNLEISPRGYGVIAWKDSEKT